jgi:hypothetical protein
VSGVFRHLSGCAGVRKVQSSKNFSAQVKKRLLCLLVEPPELHYAARSNHTSQLFAIRRKRKAADMLLMPNQGLRFT